MKTHKTLQISVKSIPETGKELGLQLGKEWFDRWREEDPGLEFTQANIRGAVNLAKHGKDILIRGRPGRAPGSLLQPLSGAFRRPGGHGVRGPSGARPPERGSG